MFTHQIQDCPGTRELGKISYSLHKGKDTLPPYEFEFPD